MPRFAVSPDDLGDAAALSSSEVGWLATARRLVGCAAGEAVGALSPGDGVLVAAVDGYAQVESAVARALSDAVAMLSGALASGCREYADADSRGALALGTLSVGAA